MTDGNQRVNPILECERYSNNGLTKREYFAAMALQGLLANPDLTKTDDATIAMTCIDAADSLIKALNK